MSLQVGARFTEHTAFPAGEVAEFARLSHDLNPLHFDRAYAQQTRFGDLIVSGPQLIARMLGLLQTAFGQAQRLAVGLEFTFQFQHAVPVDARVELGWQIGAIEPQRRLGGELVTLAGAITDAHQVVAVRATGKVVAIPTAGESRSDEGEPGDR